MGPEQLKLPVGGMRGDLLALVKEAKDSGIMLNEMHTELDRTWIEDAMQSNDNNQVRTARVLRMHRNTLRRKLEALHLHEARPRRKPMVTVRNVRRSAEKRA